MRDLFDISYFISFYCHLSDLAALARCSRKFRELFADESQIWAHIYTSRLCTTDVDLQLIIPTSGNYYQSGRFKAAFLEQISLQYLASAPELSERLTLAHRFIDTVADIGRWVNVEEDELRGLVGYKSGPVQFAYHCANEKMKTKRKLLRERRALESAPSTRLYEILASQNLLLSANIDDIDAKTSTKEWFCEAAAEFASAFVRSTLSERDSVMEWFEISIETFLLVLDRICIATDRGGAKGAISPSPFASKHDQTHQLVKYIQILFLFVDSPPHRPPPRAFVALSERPEDDADPQRICMCILNTHRVISTVYEFERDHNAIDFLLSQLFQSN